VQQIPLRLARPVQRHVALREVEQVADLGRMPRLDRQKVLSPARHGSWPQKPPVAVNAWAGADTPAYRSVRRNSMRRFFA
jgi:hypothetical protein